MKYIELSISDLEKEIHKLNIKMVTDNYKPDRIVFISKGAYLIGQYLSDLNNVPLIECHAKRKGNTLKSKLSFIMKIFPQKIKVFLREKEVKKDVHSKCPERNVYTNLKLTKNDWNNESVLVVDDSVDTGNTLKQVKDYILNNTNVKEVKTLAINVFEDSNSIITLDYYNYVNTMINGPWSNDSKYNKEFLRQYEKALKEVKFL